MADRPSTSASRVGRPRTISVHQTSHVPSSKVGGPRSKSVHKAKVKDSAKKALQKQKLVRPILPLDQDVVVVIDFNTKPDLESPTQSAVVTQQYDLTRPEVRKVSSHSHPTAKPSPKPPDIVNTDITISKMDIGTDFEENSSHQEGIIMETYKSPDKLYIQEPQNLADIINTPNLLQKYPPKQVDIDKILDVIKRKVLKGTHLPLTIKETQAGYLTSPFFKDLYRYLAQNKLPNKKSAICKVEALSEKYILLDS